jgi:hypothetical protein
MLAPANGRADFDTVEPTEGLKRTVTKPAGIRVTKFLVKAMLKYENQLRLAPEAQEAYATDGSVDITDNIQRRVAREFGFEDENLGAEILRTAERLFPDEPDIKSISHYRKYNRAVQGDLFEGGPAPDVQVASLSGEPMSLLRARGGTNPLVLIAGSYS